VLGFGAVLARELAAAGIHVLGGSARQRHVEAPVELAELVTPLVAYLDDVNTHSVNPVADAIFLELARAVRGTPTREAGGAAVADALARLGVSPAGLVQVDGSGLSREDRSSAAQITALVCAVLAADAASAELFRSSLAVAGETGTLEGRMGGDSPARARVRAKTGFIAGVSALSGVALLADGRERVFSILVEYSASIGGLNTSCWKPMQDALCERLVAP
jgi:D-alanyl-D-alanine carboxypeptidase/D-alanyl-D-alanine-endopeptidase (penicillin-binding protein 4)